MTLKRLVTNAGSLFTSETLNRATTFVIYLLVARYFDEAIFGQLSLALSLLYLVQVAAGFGLNSFLSREAAKDEGSAPTYLTHGLVIGLTGSVVALVLLLMVVLAAGYSAETRSVIMLLALAAVPFAVSDVCHGLFTALERMHLIPLVSVPAHLLKLALVWVLLSLGGGIYTVIIVMVGAQLLIGILSLVLALRLAKPGRQGFRLRGAVVNRMVKTSSTFLGINAVSAVWSIIPIFVLSLFVTEAEVGHFSAANQLLVPVALLLNAGVVAAFPMMARSFGVNPAKLRAMTHGLLAVLLALAVPATIGAMVVAPGLLKLAYGEGFEAAALALRIMAPVIVFRAVTSSLGYALMAGMLERVNLRIVTLNSLVALFFGLLLVPAFGITGAAVATLLAAVFNVVQHHLPAARLLGRIRLLSVGWRPLVSGVGMALVILATGLTDLGPAVVTGVLVYAAFLTSSHLLTLGRPPVMWQRLAQAWGEP